MDPITLLVLVGLFGAVAFSSSKTSNLNSGVVQVELRPGVVVDCDPYKPYRVEVGGGYNAHAHAGLGAQWGQWSPTSLRHWQSKNAPASTLVGMMTAKHGTAPAAGGELHDHPVTLTPAQRAALLATGRLDAETGHARVVYLDAAGVMQSRTDPHTHPIRITCTPEN